MLTFKIYTNDIKNSCFYQKILYMCSIVAIISYIKIPDKNTSFVDMSLQFVHCPHSSVNLL